MFQEKEYTAVPLQEERMLFVIEEKQGEPDMPKMIYDGKEHILLYRQADDVVVLDFLHEKIQELLKNVKEILVSEVNYQTEEAIRLYAVPVKMVKKMPIDLSHLVKK